MPESHQVRELVQRRRVRGRAEGPRRGGELGRVEHDLAGDEVLAAVEPDLRAGVAVDIAASSADSAGVDQAMSTGAQRLP